MRFAFSLTLVALAVTFSLTLAGCGGGGGSSIDSRYVGSWAAVWNSPGTSDAGTGALTVKSSGAVSGSLHNQTNGITLQVLGSLTSAGVFEGSFTYPDNTTYAVTGQIDIVGAGLQGTMVVRDASGQWLGTSNITLTRTNGVPPLPL